MLLLPIQFATAELPSPATLQQELRSFREMGSVLYVAAHPDDENTQMITYLARGKNYRTAYLSLTRGDGGQNVLGSDLDERLGVARTQELLAARREDGGGQFFTRAVDFGFSKDYRETLNVWNRQEVLADVVQIIRYFQPDVIVTRFSPQPGGTHGHHTASAVLAQEAFKLAGDTNAFPEQLKTLKPWQPTRIVMNGRGGGGGLRMEIGGDDPISGKSLDELATRSRAMHKTQGFDNFRGYGGGAGPRTETLQLLDGEPATNNLMDGVDTTWSRVAGGAEIEALTADILAKFDSTDLSANVAQLMNLRAKLMALKAESPVISEKREQLDRIIAGCLGLEARTLVASAEVVPGEAFTMKHSASLAAKVPVRWVSVRYPQLGRGVEKKMDLKPGSAVVLESTQSLPAEMPLTHPYWLREDRTVGTFRVNDLSLIVEPENPASFVVEHVFEIGGQTLVLRDEPVQDKAGPDGRDRRLDVIPPVSLGFVSPVAVFAPGASRELEVELFATRDNLSGTVALEIPSDWKVSPITQPFKLAKRDDRQTVKFTVTSPRQTASAKIVATATIGGATYRHQRTEVRYAHIPLQLLHPLAALKASNFEMSIRGKTVGYIPGAGDDVTACLRQMGYTVKVIEASDLKAESLANLDAVVIGVRAFNVRPELSKQLPILSQYVENGGTVVAQYNRPDRNSVVAPFDLQLSSSRVTDENAEITFLAPDHAALNVPNKISGADFQGWVQERGIYFPSQWDPKFTPLLACNDAGERPLQGGLLVAQQGKGYFVYTGLAFFRQLPAGVPGAYRLFANLISLGK